MKAFRILVVLAACLCFAGVAMAQDTPVVDLFGGYTFIHFNGGSGVVSSVSGATTTLTSNINGGSGSVAYNVNKWFGLAADFGGSEITTANLSGLPSVNVSSTLFTYLFGPRVSYRGWKTFTPFAQVLVGGAHVSNITSKGVRIAKAENAFAMTAGGGLDWNVTKVIAVRVVQAEYLLTRFTDPFSLTGASGTQNNFRLSAGIVFRLGSK
jgi:opacity protein-like surface antigen